MKYQFIEQYKHELPIVVMCQVLAVSESGFSAWRKRPARQRQREDAQLTEEIRQEFRAHQGKRQFSDPRVELIVGDTLNVSAFAASHEGVDVLFHAAAYFRESFGLGDHETQLEQMNVRGTLELLDAAYGKGITNMVYVSALGVLPDPSAPHAATLCGSTDFRLITPYSLHFFSYLFLSSIHASSAMLATLCSVILVLSFGAIITKFWTKISFHIIGMAGAVTIFGILFGSPVGFLLTPLVLLVGWARWRVHAHTALQVLAGAVLATSVMFVIFRLFQII